MDCPVCKTSKLVMTERQGIEIDYCPVCRGVWLDRGELDKIIERTVKEEIPGRKVFDERSGKREDYYQHYPRKKRESFLGDLFDF